MTELTPADIEVRRALVKFSRRTAKAMNSRLFISYTIPHRAKIMNTIMALGNFSTFEQLPDWLQQALSSQNLRVQARDMKKHPMMNHEKRLLGYHILPQVKEHRIES